ncbi:hypothetical protein W02_42210 [Nitrospira sp. KM1]|uniref:hypothetical protein n=1 Tax=Nitrospira sp. KM1 TaxID=1936990 RepID=UPI0013A78FB5|nr:hypothetical protein [Nitrospira sp. KM1]BCA57081.1 hypothetical protein W02_42210 [Nitrospira sp. KM1]
MAQAATQSTAKLIAVFVEAHSTLEAYLGQGAVRESELRSLALTISALQVFLAKWNRIRAGGTMIDTAVSFLLKSLQ